MRSQNDSPRQSLRELIALPVSPSAWLLAATLFFAAIPSVRVAGTVSVSFLLFAAAVLVGLIERTVHREYLTGRAMRRAAAAYAAAALLLSLSYLVNAAEGARILADPLAIRGQGWVPALPVKFMDLIWGRLGTQEVNFLTLLLGATIMPIAMLAVRLKSWREFRFMLLIWAAGCVFGAAYAVAYCNGLIPWHYEYTWVVLGRAQGLTPHPNILGINSMLAMMPLLMLMFECRSRSVLAAAVVGMALAWGGVHYSHSRSAVGGVFILVAAIMLARAADWPAQKRAAIRVALLGAAGALLLYVVLPALQLQPLSSLQRLVSGGYSSDAARDIISAVVGREIEQSPFFGSGYQVLMIAHNVYAQLVHAAGIVGLLGFALSLAVPLFLLRSCPLSGPGHQIRACLAGTMATFVALYWVKNNPSYFGLALLFSLSVYAGLAHRTGRAFDPLAGDGEGIALADTAARSPPAMRA